MQIEYGLTSMTIAAHHTTWQKTNARIRAANRPSSGAGKKIMCAKIVSKSTLKTLSTT